MEIPPSLEIAGICYNVVFNNGAIKTTDENGLEIEVDTVANVDFLNCQINISKELTDQIVDLSFMHEVVHAILFAMGYQLGQDCMNNDEVFVEGFAQLMLQVTNQILEYNLYYEDYKLAMEEDFEEEEEVFENKIHWYLR